MPDPTSSTQVPDEVRRGWVFRQQGEDGTWGNWEVATLGIPSLIAKGRERPDYEVVEVVFADDLPAISQAQEEMAERLFGDEGRSVVLDFLSSWQFCPVSQASDPSRSCLEDAAKQLLDALKEIADSGEIDAREKTCPACGFTEMMGGLCNNAFHAPPVADSEDQGEACERG